MDQIASSPLDDMDRRPMINQKPDYGLDGPGLVRALLVVGLVSAIVGLLLLRWVPNAHAADAAGYALVSFGLLCFTFASLMFASSRFGKFRARDRLLAGLKLRGDETVLDVGCGRGLLLITVAKLLPRGRAVGIDLWSQRDLSANSREATMKNAALEGVAHRVSVHDGDMRELPFPDRSFDAVVTHFAIHNVRASEGRRAAIREIVRTLKPCGQVALSHIHPFVSLYADELRRSGMIDVNISDLSFWTFPPARTVTARKPSRSV